MLSERRVIVYIPLKNPYEIVFVDDGSTDNTFASLEEIASNHDNFIISDSLFLYINTYQLKLFDGFSYVSRTIGHQSTDKICKFAKKSIA